MKRFFIRKTIIAKNIKTAIKNESKAELTEVYEDYNYNHIIEKPIGFSEDK